MRNVAAGTLVAVSLMLAGMGTYVSLLSGLNFGLAGIVLMVWMLLGVLCFRATVAKAVWSRLGLPIAFLLLTYLVFGYGLRELVRQHSEKEGFPRRYYLAAPAN